MTREEAKKLLDSELWNELLELTGEWVYSEWAIAKTVKDRERLFAQLEGSRVMDRVLRSQSTQGDQVLDLGALMEKDK